MLSIDRQHSLLGRGRHDPRAYAPYGGMGACPAPGLGFCGQYLDLLTGSYPLGNGHRFYSPRLRRFIHPDSLSPFGKGGLNAYAYCQGDPVNLVDPTGRFPAIMAPIRSIVSGVINLAISAVKMYRNYRIERDFALTSGFPASRSGIVTYGTPEQPIAPWTVKEKALSAAGVITASVSIGTASGRLFTPEAEGLAWVDFGVASVATALSAYELYGLATSPAERRYPIQAMAYQVRGGAQLQDTAV
ncbi:RHS repeat-associated core domain-containing protein [Pseudomonas putida]|uniref:RHS repeat-associated core domain-containing protein n=1 Tax=Pseudomonas putida TaxID=303 RepID=UPI002751B868|nr:RHS repeat-associated core domain-containing protein [Pseudomonas putida]MDP9523935.1 RHS repeat-associated core domain-containing protein [Pseudomonas putida]